MYIGLPRGAPTGTDTSARLNECTSLKVMVRGGVERQSVVMALAAIAEFSHDAHAQGSIESLPTLADHAERNERLEAIRGYVSTAGPMWRASRADVHCKWRSA